MPTFLDGYKISFIVIIDGRPILFAFCPTARFCYCMWFMQGRIKGLGGGGAKRGLPPISR